MKIIGIDLGTSNSVVAEYKRGETMTLPIEGRVAIPSVIYLKDGIVEIGHSAKNRLFLDPENCISSAKRYIGSDWVKKIEGQKYKAEDAAEMILSFLKKSIPEMDKVVITVPAYFEEEQRKQTMMAAEKAGLNVLRLLPEPTAAAIRYGFDKTKEQTILVLDLGGGTFDVSILEVRENEFVVKAVDGNSQLGGDDFDLAIVNYFNSWIKDNLGKDLRKDAKVQQRLKEEAERVKISLSVAKSDDVYCEVDSGVVVEINQFTRKKFRALIQEHLDEIINTTEKVIRQAGLDKEDIGRFVLVGGSCKHPIIQELIADNFKAPYISDNMDTAVAEGAAIVCASLLVPTITSSKEGSQPVGIDSPIDDKDKEILKDFSFLDVVSHSLGIDMREKGNGVFKDLVFVPIIEKNTHYPCKGAVIGMTDISQEEIRMSVFRGEEKSPGNNVKIGELNLKVPQEYILENRMVIAAIFDIDNNGLLTFTSVEMPVLKDGSLDDIKKLCTKADENQARVEVEEIFQLKEKFNYSINKIEIKI